MIETALTAAGRRHCPPAAAIVALALALGATAACDAGSTSVAAASSNSASGSSSSPAGTSGGAPSGSTGSTRPVATRPAHRPSSDVHSPFIVASAAVAKRSVANVTELHALATSAARSGGLPAAAIPTSAKALGSEFSAEITDGTMLKPPSGTSAAQLVSALTSYQKLCGQLAGWNASVPAPVATTFVSTLKAADGTWQTAVKALGQASSTDLLKGMAPLIYP
jgi:hypothetical protein